MKSFDPERKWTTSWGTAIMVGIQCFIFEIPLIWLKILHFKAFIPDLPKLFFYSFAFALAVVNYRISGRRDEYRTKFELWPEKKRARWDAVVGCFIAGVIATVFISARIAHDM